MLLLQLTGLSGSGKTTLANQVKALLTAQGYKVEIIDGDEYRQHFCPDLGFSKADRLENIRRLGFVGLRLVHHGVITILAAINPYEEARLALELKSAQVKTIFIDCPLEVVISRDVKGLYKKALLPLEHPDYLPHFTGISDPYEIPLNPHLTIHSHLEKANISAQKILDFILIQLRSHCNMAG